MGPKTTRNQLASDRFQSDESDFCFSETAKTDREKSQQLSQFARLADLAEQRGDCASARIYRRQAKG